LDPFGGAQGVLFDESISPEALTLPRASSPIVDVPTAMTTAPLAPRHLPSTPVLAIAVFAAAVAFGFAGLQISRVMDGNDRLGVFSAIEIAAATLASLGTVSWTWLVVENARRLLAAGQTTEAPSPRSVAAAWTMPLLFGAGAIIAVAFLERRLNDPDVDSTSAVPLGLACAALVVGTLVSYRPLFMLSGVMRRLGSGSGGLAGWLWVPVSLAISGAFTLGGLRAGGAYSDDFEGFAPAWAIGIVAVPPIIILLGLAWRGGRVVERAVQLAFDRRNGHAPTGGGHLSIFSRLLRAEIRSVPTLDRRKPIRLIPGMVILRLAMMTAAASLALISVLGALVMFLFWRESTDGALLASQRNSAWAALESLQRLERVLAVGLVGVASLWSFVNVLNVRIASGRPRSPVIAALSWPMAGIGIWTVADRFKDVEDVGFIIIGFVLQAAVLFVPFFLLERSALTVGARRGPLRLSYSLGVVLLVHLQSLGGLPTLAQVTDIDEFGRIAGYLVLAALLELTVTIAIADASTMISDSVEERARKHNSLAEQGATTL
jgi:hypothetical protein